MKLGDKIVQRPTIGDHETELRAGRVVYIHPEGRFYTLEFTFERYGEAGSYRESFLFDPPPMEEPEKIPRFFPRWGQAYKTNE